MWITLTLGVPPASASQAASPADSAHCTVESAAGAAATAGGLGPLDYFTNFNRYMPRTHCMVNERGETDWPWVVALILATAGVIVAYLRIFAFWVRSYRSEAPRDRVTKLMDLAWIFLWCAVCGYLMSITMFVWPAYRLLVIFLLVLNWWSWKFCADLSGFSISFSAKRLQRELAEHLHTRNAELERLVAERTEELEQERARVMDANRAKSEFLANMSHEIRTPMTAILGFTEALLEGQPAGAEHSEHLRTIQRNGQHLLKVINDILDLSKIESGRLAVERRPVDARELAGEVVELLAGRADERGLRLAVEVDAGVPARVLTDPLRLRQILLNLVGNAIKFTSSGGVTIRVQAGPVAGSPASHVLATQDRSGPADGSTPIELSFAVIDTGLGVPPELVERLFEPFTQADTSTTRRFGGTGLGLSISRRLARLLGGDIDVGPTPGGGATFTLRLPVTPVEPESLAAAAPGDWQGRQAEARPARGAPSATEAIDAAASLRCELRVLLAEDGPDNQRLITHVLARAGASVMVVGDGAQAVSEAEAAAAAGTPYDVILMDMQMPVMDGYTATQTLRGRGYSGTIIALTAHAMTGDRERCLAAGCDEFETKPLNRGRLLRKLAGMQRAGRANGSATADAGQHGQRAR